MRSGIATEAYAQGTLDLAMRHGRWRSAAVMRGYVEEGDLWTDNAAARLRPRKVNSTVILPTISPRRSPPARRRAHSSNPSQL